jgi:hypothetical protein
MKSCCVQFAEDTEANIGNTMRQWKLTLCHPGNIALFGSFSIDRESEMSLNLFLRYKIEHRERNKTFLTIY